MFSQFINYNKIKDFFNKENNKSDKSDKLPEYIKSNTLSSKSSTVPILLREEFIPSEEDYGVPSKKNKDKTLEDLEPIEIDELENILHEPEANPSIEEVDDINYSLTQEEITESHYLEEMGEFYSEIPVEYFENYTSLDIYVGLYCIHKSIRYNHFLTYLLEKNTNADYYHFPHFQHEFVSGVSSDILNTKCQNECKKKIFNALHIIPGTHLTENRNSILENIVLKGYLIRDKEILAIFMTTEREEKLGKNMDWATMHEIINTNQLSGITINPFVSQWFLENPFLIYLKDNYNNHIEIPYTLYLYEKKEKKTEEKKTEEKDRKLSILKNRNQENELSSLLLSITHHPILKEIFLFSIEKTHKIEKEMRYVVFIVNTLFLLDNEPDLPLYFNDKNKIYSSIYYQDENETPIWGLNANKYFGIL